MLHVVECHRAECYYAGSRYAKCLVMLSVIRPGVVLQNVLAPAEKA